MAGRALGKARGASQGPLLICQAWIGSYRHASCPSEGLPGFRSCLLPRKKSLLELLKLASIGTAPAEKGSLLYCLLSWWHSAYYCWFGLGIWLFQGLIFRTAFQCSHCIPAPAGSCIWCSAPVHLKPLSFGNSSFSMHADFYVLVDLLPASIFLQPCSTSSTGTCFRSSQTLFLEVICFKAYVITGRNLSLQRGFKTALFGVSYSSAFFSCSCLRKNCALDSFYNWHGNFWREKRGKSGWVPYFSCIWTYSAIGKNPMWQIKYHSKDHLFQRAGCDIHYYFSVLLLQGCIPDLRVKSKAHQMSDSIQCCFKVIVKSLLVQKIMVIIAKACGLWFFSEVRKMALMKLVQLF